MNLNQKQFSEFVAARLKACDLKQKEIAEKLGCTQPAISNALRKSDWNNSRYNGTRKDILKLFGYQTENLFSVKGANERIKL